MKLDAPVIAAGITGFVALVVALWTRRTSVTVEQLKAALADQSKERDARRDYEYEARKRLYEELEPLLFRLVDASDEAWHRILSLARSARRNDIAANGGWLDSPENYYLRSTVYKLLVPMAVVRLFEEKLTFVDLAVEPRLRDQYFLAKTLDRSFTDDFALAANLSYDPNDEDAFTLRKENPAMYWRQGLYLGALDIAAGALIVRDAQSKPRIMGYGDFEKTLTEQTTDAFDEVLDVFLHFHPTTRPVLWRILVAQAAIYKTFVCLRSLPRTAHFDPLRHLRDEELALLAWKVEPAVDDDLKEVARIAHDHVRTTFRRISGG
jgi:hypothetical protein